MLNISSNTVSKEINIGKFPALNLVQNRKVNNVLSRIILISFLIFTLALFIPWTQNIRSNGNLTTLKPSDRPQNINSVIPGRIEEWFVIEGDTVKKGDTIVFLSEMKTEYMDPRLLERTADQQGFKEEAVKTYSNQISTIENQISALREQRVLKINQADNKIKQLRFKRENDSISYEVKSQNFEIAEEQYERFVKMYNDGLKSLTDKENRDVKLQQARSYKVSAYNKWLETKNKLLNVVMEKTSVGISYENKINKLKAEKLKIMSHKLDAASSLTKLDNQYSNYQLRRGMYYVTAPQDGIITKTIKSGIGEVLKEGDPIVTIMPAQSQLAVEIYVDPLDLPLISIGNKVRLQFDGWPAIIFSGWPEASYGTYGGKVYAIDNFISPNGQYRVLVQADEDDKKWPSALRVGSGTKSIMLLNNVPIWYELWRKVNGFPPDFYIKEDDKSKKKPSKGH